MISLIIPTLNEVDVIERLVQKIIALGLPLELIIVDDGSTDGTREKARALPNVTLIERTERGLATAVLCGFGAARGDIIGVMDADFSHPVSVIPRLVAAIQDGADIAVGSRYVAGGGAEEWPFLRKLYSLGATVAARPLTRGVKDPMSGFFFVRRAVIDGMALAPVGYKILLEILVKGQWQRAVEVPIVFRNRTAGKSKMNVTVTLAYFLHAVRLYAYTAHRWFSA